MNKILLLILVVMSIVTTSVHGQDKAINNGFGFGFQLNQYQRDFGIGLNITSPYFDIPEMAVRLRGNLMFNEYVQNQVTKWTPYFNASLGLIGGVGKIGDYIRLYGEGGMILLFPSELFSSDQVIFGGYGLFGFEFFMSNSPNYFIEIGGVGSGAIADKIANQPIYSNGLSVSVGFRMTLK